MTTELAIRDFSISHIERNKCLDCGKQLKTFHAKRCASCNMRLVSRSKKEVT